MVVYCKCKPLCTATQWSVRKKT